MYNLEEFAFDGFRADLNEVSGFSYEKTQLFASIVQENYDEILFVPSCSKFLLIAPEGYGKWYLTNCFAQTLRDVGYSLYRIDCEEIMEEESPEELWEELFEGILEKTNPERYDMQSVFLHLENLSALKENKKCTNRMASFLKKLSDWDRICIVISTDETGKDIPTTILKHFVVLELDVPDEDDRKAFFEKTLEFSVANPDNLDETVKFCPLDFSVESEDISEEEILEGYNQLSVIAGFCADKTEGLSFGQLDLVVNQLIKKAKVRLLDATSGNPNLIFSSITRNSNCIVTEQEFDDIIERVKKTGSLLVSEQTKSELTKSEQTNTAIPPQIIYVGAFPGTSDIQQMNIPRARKIDDVEENNTQSQEEYEKFLEDGSGENPKVAAIRDVYKSITRNNA